MKRTTFLVSLACITFLLLSPRLAPAYEGISVKDGGTISGVVKFQGHVPPPRRLQITKDVQVCGKTPKYDQSLVVSAGDIRYAVVSLKGIQRGKPMEPTEVVLDQQGCQYHPEVLAFPVGSTIKILNQDGVLHNIHSYSVKNTPFNMAQPAFRKSMTVKIKYPETINIKCDVHAWMNGWLYAAENPYFSVTDANGRFRITDVPAGTYTIEVWHETLGKEDKTVTVRANEQVKVDFEMKGK